MNLIRPTFLALASDACPHAVTLAERGAARDRRHFAAGQAAHTYLEAVAKGEDPEVACADLFSRGRDGVDAEPPLALDSIAEGHELARRWLAKHGPPPAGALIEVPISDGVLTTRIDVGWMEEGPRGLIAVVRDWKTSWRDDESRVLRTQAKVQVLAALATWPEVVGVRVEIANLRLSAVYGDTVYRDDERLDGWRGLLHAAAKALQGERRPAPGPVCLSCPYVLSCEFPEQSPGEAVGEWIAAAARADALERAARDATVEGPICDVGWHVVETRTPAEGFAPRLADMLGWPEAAPLLERLKLGVSNVEAAVKTVWAGKSGAEDRDKALAELLTLKAGKRWGHKK
jgi:hypothetical protein